MKKFCFVLAAIILCAAVFTVNRQISARAENENNLVSQTVVISQFYGGGGLTNAQYTHDFVELFNRGSQPISLNGWSVQYASATGSNWLPAAPLPNVTLQPGQYFLIQFASNGANGSTLPAPDFIAPVVQPEGFIPNLSSTTGKLALVNNSARLPVSSCPSDSAIVDLVGFGDSASCFEAVRTANLSVATAGRRNDNGCAETDNNSLDFTIAAPAPRNTASPANACNLGGSLQASGTATPNNVTPGNSVLFRVTVFPATTPPSTGVTVTGNLSGVGGAANQQFFDDGTNGDATAGDNIFSFQYMIPSNASGGARTVPVTVTDAQGRTANPIINLTITAVNPNDDPLLLGNPTNAATNVVNETNYLMVKPQYALSYHRHRGIANWVAWRLDASWIGSAPRQDDYRPDPDLPAGWYQVQDADYSGSGYDRGHMTPSGDRTRSIPDNSATFLMTNFVPQLAANNQGPWEEFETYCRSLANAGQEIYIFSGGHGSAGTIAQGRVTIPLVTWKVALVLPNGDNDLQRVGKNTRTIAVVVPNQPPVNINAPWRQFRVTVDQVEALTGFNFFSNVPKHTQEIIERRRDLQ